MGTNLLRPLLMHYSWVQGYYIYAHGNSQTQLPQTTHRNKHPPWAKPLAEYPALLCSDLQTRYAKTRDSPVADFCFFVGVARSLVVAMPVPQIWMPAELQSMYPKGVHLQVYQDDSSVPLGHSLQ